MRDEEQALMDGPATTLDSRDGPLAAYRARRAAGLLEPDSAQLFAAEKLQSLHNALGRPFEALFEDGIVVVATSNYAPDDLYKDGLQRENFLPFIALIKERLDILELDGGKDYRRRRIQGLDVYHTPLGGQATAALDA